MTKKRFWRMVTLGIRQFRDPYYQGFAAQLSFYFLMSIVPIVILLSQVLLNVFHLSIDQAVDWILEYTKGPLHDEMRRLLAYKTGKLGSVIYIFITLWAASGAQFSMMRITNFMFTEGRSTGKGYFRERFRAILNMLIFLIIIVLAMVALVFGGQILDFAGVDPRVWEIIRWPVALILYFMIISYNYYIMPSDKLKFRQIIPGSIFAAIGMVAVTMVYSYYAMHADYSVIYGVLGNLVAIMLWFYILAWVLCLGVLFNKVWMDTSANGSHQDGFL
ncbi:MAG: YihY/virulence factor BrkB family protein [Anaerovoracaceae bacterium]|jgi:membrane protein